MTITGGSRASKKAKEKRKARKAREKKFEQTAKKPKKKKKVTTLPTIEAKAPEKKKTILQKAGDVITSPKTTVALATILAGVATAGAGAGLAAGAARTGTAVITRTATGVSGVTKGISLTAQRAFTGKSAKFALDKVFHAARPIAAKYATNPKSVGLTTSLIKKTMTVVKNPAFIIGAIGSYPFASFIKEEAIQTLSIPIMKAVGAGDLETATALTEDVDAMLADSGGLLAVVPYANVVKRLISFFEAAGKANDAWKEIIATESATMATEATEPSFEEQRTASDEAARTRSLENRAKDAEYFRLIREGKFEEAQEILDSELKGGNENE